MNMSSSKSFQDKTHSINLLARLNRQRLENRFCDVELQVKYRKFPAHRSVLAGSSEYFETMFTTNMKEKHEREVTIEGISPSAMEDVLNFLYTEKVKLNGENVTGLLQAASIMRIMNLLQIIVNYLSAVLGVTNCLYFRDLGQLYSLEVLIGEADKCIMEKFEEISLQPGFCDLKHQNVIKLITSDDLTVEYERVVYEALVTWVKHDLLNRRKLFPKLFKHIRLQLMETDYLVDSVRKEALVREFIDCRDLVEDAFLFHVNPQKYETQVSRKGQKNPKAYFNPNSIIMFSQQYLPHVFNITNKTWIGTDLHFAITPGCARATVNDTTVFCGGRDVNNKASRNVISVKASECRCLPPMNTPRAGASSCYIKETLFVFGGYTTLQYLEAYEECGAVGSWHGKSEAYVQDFESYTDLNQAWATVGQVATSRSNASAVSLQDRAYIIGGNVENKKQQQPQSSSRDLRAASLMNPASLSSLRIQHSNECMESRKRIVPTTNTMDIYNSTSSEWTTGPSMRSARASFGAAVWNNRIYVVGGINQNGSSVNTSEYFDSDSNMWINVNIRQLGRNLRITSACCIGDCIYILVNREYLCILDVVSNRVEKINSPIPGDWITPITWNE